MSDSANAIAAVITALGVIIPLISSVFSIACSIAMIVGMCKFSRKWASHGGKQSFPSTICGFLLRK